MKATYTLTPEEAEDLKSAVLASVAASGSTNCELITLDLIEAFKAIKAATAPATASAA